MPTFKRLSFQPSARHLIAAPVLAGLLLTGCGSDDADSTTTTTEQTDASSVTMSIAEAWSREPANGQTTSAVYGVVTNPTDEDVTIISATADAVSTDVQLHETTMGEDGTMKMSQKEGGFVVPANGTFTFEPGGPHIMLLDIDPATYPESVEVTLDFDNADPLTFDAEVRPLTPSDMTGSSMDMGDDMTGSSMDMENS